MLHPISIHWFDRDLRCSDSRALSHAAQHGAVLPVFIWDPEQPRKLGGASRWWLSAALEALDNDLGGALLILQGRASSILPKLVRHAQARHLTFSQRYDPVGQAQQAAVVQSVEDVPCDVYSGTGQLLWNPDSVVKGDGTPYRVFTPFFRKGCLSADAPAVPIEAPEVTWAPVSELGLTEAALAELGLKRIRAQDIRPNGAWTASLKAHWSVAEGAAQDQIFQFIERGLPEYKAGRDFPAKETVSRLSPYLAWGLVSPNQAWWAATSAYEQGRADWAQVDHFKSELGWREFSYTLLRNFPDLHEKNWNAKFDHYPWRRLEEGAGAEPSCESAQSDLKAWQAGQTGIPIVDAGMRELWATGYMHNRVRMIVASFLVKNLGFHWSCGEQWFWDTLVDADPANNPAGWQWVAGSGADAAPYFRIFNPVTQAQKFDPQGVYIRRWVPELASVADKAVFQPNEGGADLFSASLRHSSGGSPYPRPIVDLKTSRARALQGYDDMKSYLD